jgi:type I restriction enzyme S subunit
VRIATGQVDPRIEPYREMILVAPDLIESGTGRLLSRETASDQRAISGKYVFGHGDIVYSKIRPYLRKAVLAEFDGLCSADMYPLKPAVDVSGAFMLGVLLEHRFTKYAESVSVRSGIPKINRVELADFVVALPPLPEQRAIATASSDVDALLGGLDRLIAKKRDLKHAVMQQLLSGQTRLPGFHAEWEVKRLGDYATFLRNGVNSRAELLAEGRVKYLHYGDVHGCKDVYLSPDPLPCLPGAKAASLDRLRDGDLVIADASEDVVGVSKSVEMRGLGISEVVSGLHTIAARFDKNVLADGFKGLLQFCPPFATHLRRLAAGTKVYATNRAHVASVEMRLPTVAEQTAIAAVLSDMDAEESALEARRDKTRDLKQAMMQVLLTGKIRLVPVGAVHA